VRNAEATGEFVYNLATRALAGQVNQSSLEQSEVNEFELAGLTPVTGLVVAAPRVGESPVAMECKVTQIQPLTTLEGRTLDTWMVYGEVVAVHIDQSLLVEGVYDTAAAQHILRGGGPADYFEVLPQGRFQMRRPK